MSMKSQENNMRRLAILLKQNLSYIGGERECGPNGAKKAFLNLGKVFLRALAKDLRVSVITTKRAYDELEADGFLYTVAGKGCFVAPQNPELVREDTLRRAEEHLSHAVDVAKAGGVTLAELTETLNLLYGDETL